MNYQENPIEKVGEFHYNRMLFVVVSWGGRPAAYIPGRCRIVELSGWGLYIKRRIMDVWNNQ